MKQLKESISARCIAESILDSDFDITGIEYIQYDWMDWQCLETVTERINICNEHIYINNVTPIIDKFQQELVEDLERYNIYGKTMTKNKVRQIKEDLDYIKSKIIGFGSNITNLGSRIKMFKIVDELLSMPCGKIFKRTRNNDVSIAINNINEKETPILKIVFWKSISDNDMKIVSNDIDNLCKKHKFKYATGKKTDSNKAPWASWWYIDMTV